MKSRISIPMYYICAFTRTYHITLGIVPLYHQALAFRALTGPAQPTPAYKLTTSQKHWIKLGRELILWKYTWWKLTTRDRHSMTTAIQTEGKTILRHFNWLLEYVWGRSAENWAQPPNFSKSSPLFNSNRRGGQQKLIQPGFAEISLGNNWFSC